MHMILRRAVLILIPVIIVSCDLFHKSRNIDDDKYVDIDTTAAPESESDFGYEGEIWTGPSEILYSKYKGSETKTWDLLHTSLDLDFDFEQRSCQGTARLTLKSHSWEDIKILELDAVGMDISSVLWIDTLFEKHDFYKTEDIIGTALNWTYSDSAHLKIELPVSCSHNRIITIEIAYTAHPYRSRMKGNDAINGDRGLYFINHDLSEPGKPRQIWTQGETESSCHWFPTLDAPNQKTTLDIRLTVPDTMVSLSNGNLVHSAPSHRSGFRTDRWVQKMPHAPYLTMVAVGNWAVVKDTWRGKEVNYLLEKKYEPFARLIFSNTPAMLEFFSNYLGVDYPWDKYSQVVVRDFVSGAMENTTATVHMEALQHTDREHRDETYEDYISHELFHQWFGDLVTTESWSNITLNESFATYGEYLWREHHYGSDNAEVLLSDLRDQYRMYGMAEGKHLVRYDYEDAGDLFDNVSYQKGACILHMLRRTIGEQAFRESLRRYLTKYRFQTAEVADFRMVVEDVCGRDMNWFFNQWYFDADHPAISLSLEKKAGAGWMLRVEQTQQHRNTYAFPVKITWDANGKTQEQTFFAGSRVSWFDLKTTEKPQWFIFDSDNSLLCDDGIMYQNVKEAETALNMIAKAWDHAGTGSRQRLFGNAADIASAFENAEMASVLESAIGDIYLKAVNSGFEPLMAQAMEFAGGNPVYNLIVPTADGETVDGNLMQIAGNEKLRPETRKVALAQLYYSGMNSRSMLRFTRDSSIAVSLFAIGYLYDQTIWEPYAVSIGVNDPHGAIASAWARKLIIYGKSAYDETLFHLALNPATEPEHFVKALNALFYYAPEDVLADVTHSLAEKLNVEGKTLMLSVLTYKLRAEIRHINAEIAEMDDNDPELLADLTRRKTAFQNIVDTYSNR